jgi:superfamily I DNA/RNA helicase
MADALHLQGASSGPFRFLALPSDGSCAGLNEAQQRAVYYRPDGALAILAGPGSGKTHTVTARVAQMVLAHGYQPSKIVVCTFTNKAAKCAASSRCLRCP